MKITTRLRFAQLCCLVLMLFMAAVFTAASISVREEIAKADVTAAVFRASAGLRYLSLEYVLHHDDRSRGQWWQQHHSLGLLVTENPHFASGEEVDLFRDLQQQHRSSARLFSQLQDLRLNDERDTQRRALLEKLEARLVGLMMQRTQSMIAVAEALTRLRSARIVAAQDHAMLVGGGLGVTVLVVVLWAMGMTVRSVAVPLSRLHHVTLMIGQGKLELAPGPIANDEIGNLATAFNHMIERLQATTVSRDELLEANQALHAEMLQRKTAEARVLEQLNRLSLLQQITRSIGERQDLTSIFQVVVRSLEDQMPVDFGAVCMHVGNELVVRCVGVRSYHLSMELAMSEEAHIPIDRNGLSRCLAGNLVYEADLSTINFPFPQRLANGGMRSMILAPLQAENTVFGVLVVARPKPNAFSSADCEFLRQLSEHVALAANQAQLYAALHKAFSDLHESQAQVTRQERLRALGQMASGIAHDINNAISPIGLYAEALLENEHGLSERGRASLHVIERAIDDVSATVARLREFYRHREGALAPTAVNINLMIQHVIELTRARWYDMPQKRGVAIEISQDLSPTLPSVLGVEAEIRDALTNLVFNAIDALPNGGEVTLRTRYQSSNPPDCLGEVQVQVCDNGHGMDEVTQSRCLDPFFTTKGERGTGLGLATVYGMVQRHNARIAIASKPGIGTEVSLHFPILSDPIVGNVPVPLRVPRPLRILIIDDDPTLLSALCNILELDGHHVTQVDGGQAGIDCFIAAQAGQANFELVITDLGMPYVDGRKVAEAIRQHASEVPIILLTGWGQRIIPETNDELVNVNQVLSKPPKLSELRMAILNWTSPDRLAGPI